MQSGLQIPFIETFSNFSGFFNIIFYVVVLIFAVHAVIVIYHWHTFGTDRTIATTATIIYLGVGAVIIAFGFLMLNLL